jgi:hypothetical protein
VHAVEAVELRVVEERAELDAELRKQLGSEERGRWTAPNAQFVFAAADDDIVRRMPRKLVNAVGKLLAVDRWRLSRVCIEEAAECEIAIRIRETDSGLLLARCLVDLDAADLARMRKQFVRDKLAGGGAECEDVLAIVRSDHDNDRGRTSDQRSAPAATSSFTASTSLISVAMSSRLFRSFQPEKYVRSLFLNENFLFLFKY